MRSMCVCVSVYLLSAGWHEWCGVAHIAHRHRYLFAHVSNSSRRNGRRLHHHQHHRHHHHRTSIQQTINHRPANINNINITSTLRTVSRINSSSVQQVRMPFDFQLPSSSRGTQCSQLGAQLAQHYCSMYSLRSVPLLFIILIGIQTQHSQSQTRTEYAQQIMSASELAFSYKHFAWRRSLIAAKHIIRMLVERTQHCLFEW